MSRPRQASHVLDVQKIRERAEAAAACPAPIYENPLRRPSQYAPAEPQRFAPAEPEPEPDFNVFSNMIIEERPKASKVRKVFRQYVEELNDGAELF